MKNVYVGKVVGTHGIKGEIRILSCLSKEEKKEAFKISTPLWIKGIAYQITSYRPHKAFDMVTLKGFTDINQVLFLLQSPVLKEASYFTESLLDQELLTYTVLTVDGKKGLIKEIEQTGPDYKVLRLLIDKEEMLLPYHQDFIVNLDRNAKTITVRLL